VNVLATELEGVLVIEPRVFSDARGFFYESYRADRYAAAGLPACFVQDNHSCSAPGTLRGLHYQFPRAQGKLIRVLRGAVFDVAVDIRRGSPSFGRWVGVVLSADNKRQLYVPPGYAHGFCVPGEASEMAYKCTAFYAPEDEHGVLWNDPTIGIPWPIKTPLMSERDRAYQPLSRDRLDLPDYGGSDR
jgi:dTDP-4-dehydrorhamnose 3,5-epimerase